MDKDAREAGIIRFVSPYYDCQERPCPDVNAEPIPLDSGRVSVYDLSETIRDVVALSNGQCIVYGLDTLTLIGAALGLQRLDLQFHLTWVDSKVRTKGHRAQAGLSYLLGHDRVMKTLGGRPMDLSNISVVGPRGVKPQVKSKFKWIHFDTSVYCPDLHVDAGPQLQDEVIRGIIESHEWHLLTVSLWDPMRGSTNSHILKALERRHVDFL